MNIREIEARLAAIAAEVENPGADLDALEKEARDLKKARADLMEQAEKRSRILADVAGMTGAPVVTPTETRSFENMTKEELAATPEYRSAFFKNLLGMDMTKEERAAFTHTTDNSGQPLPTTMHNNIVDLVNGQHAIMGDITTYRTGTILEVVKHTTIVAGKAKKVAEGTANDDEQNTFVKVTLSGNDFSKSVDISYAMAKMSISALEQYLTTEIAAGLGEAMAEDVITTIEAGINSANKQSTAAAEIKFTELAKVFGALKRVGAVTVYATRATIYNYLVGMVDQSGRPIFQANAQNGAEGTVLGATIKVEDGVADNKLLIGDPKKVVYNMVQDIMVEKDKDIKNHVYTYSGYARGEGALIDDKAFAELTVTA